MTKVVTDPSDLDAGKSTIYDDAMSSFEATADLLTLDERVRMELRQPHHELIFYITADIKDRLEKLSEAELGELSGQFDDLPDSELAGQDYKVLPSGVSRTPGHVRAQLQCRDGATASSVQRRPVPDPDPPPRGLQVLSRPATTTPRPVQGRHPYHHQVSLDLFKALAAEMSGRRRSCNIPRGGGKGGIKIDPRNYSSEELERISLRFMYKLKPFVGPNTDIPAPDVGTDSVIMGHFFRQYTDGEREPAKLRGCVTGKDVRIWGSEGREAATGRGLSTASRSSCATSSRRTRQLIAPTTCRTRMSAHTAGVRQRRLQSRALPVPKGAKMVAGDTGTERSTPSRIDPMR